ncbi:hypothetical protein SAMN05421823_102545 [Catalinimonas alkaloidigena]|uniref:Uncharacterized protein n=1 Tax=Catalinimonas alkaloidigena TaxID=1075417 RepID=A0A1G9BA38_9BACT|nr:hypothetical protein [Catalinimonas alkaloidigena]SDK35735.1 hypothetical protein SAMN05421823_102545 [Catalinimonas alkaloidigena]
MKATEEQMLILLAWETASITEAHAARLLGLDRPKARAFRSAVLASARKLIHEAAQKGGSHL